MTQNALAGIPKEDILGFECKHVLYVEAQDRSPNDLLVIKEYAHLKDGRLIPNLRTIRNEKRPFWITREMHRKHKDKKEWERLDRLQKFESTQIMLTRSIQRAMGRAPTQTTMRMLARSPYLYGCDVTPPVLMKRRYMDQWPNLISNNKVAVVDSETDMVEGHEEIIMLGITMKSQCKIIIVKDYLKDIHDPSTKIHEKFEKYLGHLKQERNINLEIEYVDNAGDCTYRLLQTAHEWQPDIMAIWNMNFDVPRMNRALEKYGYDLAQVWSDPRVPPMFRSFNYKEGPAQKVTASGKTMALHPAEQWHVVETPASFYVLDAMCVYLKLRIAKGKEASYSLDYILKKHKLAGKLKFEEADHLSGGLWHEFMQKNYKIEYCIYNLYDCISMELLDEKTTDLARMVSAMCGHSEYHRFPSQPRRTCDDLHFFALEDGKVCATTSDKMEDELDEHVVSLTNWIVTLPSHLVFDDGLKCIEELPNVSTLIRAHVADLDVEGTYPNVEIICNISKETTSKELSRIRGVDEVIQRSIGINLSGGHVNAVEICVNAYGAPTMDTLLEAFREKRMAGSRARPAMMAALHEEQSRPQLSRLDNVEEFELETGSGPVGTNTLSPERVAAMVQSGEAEVMYTMPETASDVEERLNDAMRDVARIYDARPIAVEDIPF